MTSSATRSGISPRNQSSRALTSGTYDAIAGADSFGDINGAFPGR
ncbi:MAG TPA: hypothetical protein VF070_10300 [Streptosporangiaceae bacterium]